MSEFSSKSSEQLCRAAIRLLHELLRAREPKTEEILKDFGWTLADLEAALEDPTRINLAEYLESLVKVTKPPRREDLEIYGRKYGDVGRDYTGPVREPETYPGFEQESSLGDEVEAFYVDDFFAANDTDDRPVWKLLTFLRRLALYMLERGILDLGDLRKSRERLDISIQALKDQGRLPESVS